MYYDAVCLYSGGYGSMNTDSLSRTSRQRLLVLGRTYIILQFTSWSLWKIKTAVV